MGQPAILPAARPATTSSISPSRDRLKALVVPREHGAWGLLLMPLLVGGLAGLRFDGEIEPVLILMGGALSLFWLRAPVESLLGTSPMYAHPGEERRQVLRMILITGLIALLFLGALFWDGKNQALLPLGVAAAIMLAAQAVLKKLGRATRMASQIVGALGLTVTAPASYYVSTGNLDERAFGLWLATFLFVANQIHFVQLRIHGAKLIAAKDRIRQGAGFIAGELLILAALAVAVRSGWLTALSSLAFLPAIFRGTAWFFRKPQPISVRRLGWSEVLQSILFGALLLFGVYNGAFRLR